MSSWNVHVRYLIFWWVFVKQGNLWNLTPVRLLFKLAAVSVCWYALFYAYDNFGVGIMFSNSVSPFICSSGLTLLPRYLMNGLSNVDESYRGYSSVPTDDLIRFWRLKVKVTAGRRGCKFHEESTSTLWCRSPSFTSRSKKFVIQAWSYFGTKFTQFFIHCLFSAKMISNFACLNTLKIKNKLNSKSSRYWWFRIKFKFHKKWF